MSYTKNTLDSIIARSFGGKKSHLAKAAGLSPRIITMITGDQRPTHANLNAICGAISTEDARDLCLAAARDLIPAEYSDGLYIRHPEDNSNLHSPHTTYNGLDPHSDLILENLRRLVARDPDACEWLHLTAKWLFHNLDD